jgi:phage portal protein BeeE
MADNNIFTKVMANVARFLKADSTEKQDPTANKKALALDSGLFSGYYGSSLNIKENGLPKPGKISFNHLRKISKYDPLIRICVNVIKKEVSQSEWDVISRKSYNAKQEHIDWAYALFDRVNKNGENLRELLDRVLEDMLILDAGVIEKVYNAKGELMELNSVDGATIRPVVNEYGELDENRAYVQIIRDKTVAEFKPSEIIYMMQNPQNDIEMFGYGMSPIESILLTVQASLNAEMYNAKVFSEDNIPPGILDLGGMNEDEAQNFIALWNATVIGQTHKMKFVYGNDSAKKYTPFVQNNKDMQFVEYIDWLSRIKLAAFGLTTLDANITQDVNRATAETQLEITNSRGVRTVKRLIEEYIDREIFMPMGFDDIQFKFEPIPSIRDKKAQAEVDEIYINTGVYTPTDVAKREGFDVSAVEEVIANEFDYGASPNPNDNEMPAMPVEEDVVERRSNTRQKYFRPLYK